MLAALKSKIPWQVAHVFALYLALVLFGLFAKSCNDASTARAALANRDLALARDSSKALRATIGALEKRHTQQLAHFAATESRYDSLAARYRITERVLVNTRAARLAGDPTPPRIVYDTVPVPVEVVRTIVQTADSAIAACHLLASTCEERVAARDALLTVRNTEIAALKKLRPSWFARVRWSIRDVAIGYALGKVVKF